MRPRRDSRTPPYVDSLFVLFHFEVSLSANGGASDRERFLSPFARSTVLEFFTVLNLSSYLTLRIFKYIAYWQHCFHVSRFLSSEHSLLRISLSLRLVCDTRTKKSPMCPLPHVILEPSLIVVVVVEAPLPRLF